MLHESSWFRLSEGSLGGRENALGGIGPDDTQCMWHQKVRTKEGNR